MGRFLLLRETEEKVRRLLDGARTPAAVCAEFERQHAGALSLPTLVRFLAKLDEAGILAGEHAHRPPPPDQQPGTQFYWRFKLFNPDRLFTRMVGYLRWVWTPGFVFFSVALTLTALLLGLTNGAEVTSYSLYVVREHFLMILIASELIALSHEFAHGLTCKAFGGRVPEVGVLQIYYVLPALYCNVSGIHLIQQRNRRLWVILAGIYWQVLVGTRLLLRVHVPEREIGDVRVGHPVRLRTRAFPDRAFYGAVSKIGGEGERDENNSAVYRVELTIENADGVLRPGMTAFARIDFGRQLIGSLLLRKIKRALRPELWML